jgi:hypothetical protein
MAAAIPATKTFTYSCLIENHSGRHWIVKSGAENTRVLEMGQEGEGFVVPTEWIKDKRNEKKKKKESTETPTEVS